VHRWWPIVVFLLPLPVLADVPAPAESAEVHARTGVQTHAQPTDVPVPERDSARDVALTAVEGHVACVCYEAGQLQIDAGRSLRQGDCGCAEAARVRGDLEHALAALPTAELTNKRRVAETLEAGFVPLRAEYERVWRTPEADYAWFMDNVRCICEGCKPTIFFSKCQLSCAPGILYKLRARIFMGLGFSRDELLDYYLAEINASRPAREQVTRDFLLPRLQRERGWLVPLLAILGAMVLGYGAVRRWAQRQPEDRGPTPAPTPLTAAQRARVRRAMEDDDGG
jgi:hypothetical protein